MAVHTRHEYTDVLLIGFTSRPEQYYGDCAIGPLIRPAGKARRARAIDRVQVTNRPRTARPGKPGAGRRAPARACRGFGAQPQAGKPRSPIYQKIASGFTGDPVPPGTRNGAITSMKSH